VEWHDSYKVCYTWKNFALPLAALVFLTRMFFYLRHFSHNSVSLMSVPVLDLNVSVFLSAIRLLLRGFRVNHYKTIYLP
jgi:hypothetical protein